MLKNDFREIWEKIKKPFFWLCGINLIGISAILRANYYYIDDLGRASSGLKGWDHFSRWISVWLSSVIHTDHYLADVAPLPQLLAVVLLAIAGAVTIYLIGGAEISPFWGIVAVVPLSLSPFYLECLSYRYDAPYIALSVLVSVVPPLLFGGSRRSHIIYLTGTVICMLIMCMTYQASSGIFPMLVAVLLFKRWNDGEKIKSLLSFIGISILGYLIGLGIFKYLILKQVFSYVTTYQAPVLSLPSVLYENLRTYFSVIIRDFKPLWLILIAALFLFFIIQFMLNSKRNKLSALVAGLLLIAILLPLSFGVYSILEKSFFAPRALYGFGAFLAFIALLSVSGRAFPLSRFAALALSWVFFVFAFVYGNCLYVQAQYTDFRVQMVINDLNSLEEYNNENLKIVKFSGDIGYSPLIEGIPQRNYTMLSSLLKEPFGDATDLSTTGFYYYYKLPDIVRYDLTTKLDTAKLPILKDTVYHTIRGNGTDFLIELK